ncbi:hypothetical protein FHR83_005249 [Actinoplanes campanulatus]|uniref:Uncharacterized protein n=1 Tax=Actinoplanes campanulatus TaxID=113559 RepID=A0A7W5FGI3_9ACTN|nr:MULTISPECIES: hypothetical protein [Actinoplanes]MBB3097571.1 hypothetical protein [Actinoplanes campanulatus]GGN27640.1 hypothetical protein GCM10010109_45410 [Actinoplanes campanulatus]GID37966.1 hypothetical protein Aca09nite_44720 [Actinoplanes campanulatus]
MRNRVDYDNLGPIAVQLLGQAEGGVKPDVTCSYDDDARRIHASIVARVKRLMRGSVTITTAEVK